MECDKPILIVEDNAAVREAMSLVLAMNGYPVATAANGADALDYLRSNEPPCLILLDLGLPGLDGRDFLQRQSGEPRLAGVPVVIVSAAADAGAVASSLGASGYLLKPVEPGTLLAVVRRFVAKASPPEVLLVESEPDVRGLLASALRQHGFLVQEAADGPEAVELYRGHHDCIGLVLLDTHLGNQQTLAALRDIDPQVRCCLLDRNADAARALRELMQGA